MTVARVHVRDPDAWRHGFDHLVIAEIDGYVSGIEDQVSALPLTDRNMQEAGIIAHVIRVMTVPRVIPVCGRIVILQIHAGRIERLHNEPCAIYAVAWLHGIIPDISGSEIVVRPADERVYDLAAVSVDADF